jgi:hypothetical protein
MGEIDNYCLAQGIPRTATGGYNAKKNIIVENRNKTAGERLRKCLATATGGNNYWAELTGPCMAHVIRLINIMDWSNGKNPHLAITGEKYGVDKTIQPFGCMYGPDVHSEGEADLEGNTGLKARYLSGQDRRRARWHGHCRLGI